MSGCPRNLKTVVDGLDDVVARAFQKEALFSELAVPWARPAEVFRIEGYESFNGGRAADG